MKTVSEIVREETRKAVKEFGLLKVATKAGLSQSAISKLVNHEDRDYRSSTLDALAVALKLRLQKGA